MNSDKWSLRKVAVMIILLSFLYVFSVTFLDTTEVGKEHSKTIVGFLLGTGFTTLLNYYWGSAHKRESEIQGKEQK